MARNKVVISCLFVILDVLFTFTSLGFFSPQLKFNPSLIREIVFLRDGYSFTRSPFDFVVLLSLRNILIAFAIFLNLLNKISLVQSLSLPCLGLSVTVVSFSITKLLAFSEYSEYLAYVGLWFLQTWTIFSSAFLYVLWYLVLASEKSAATYIRFFDSDGPSLPSSTSIDIESDQSSEKTKELSTFQRIKHVLSYFVKEWRWYLLGLVFLIGNAGVRIFIPYFIGLVMGDIIHSKGIESMMHSLIIMSLLILISSILCGFRGGCFVYASSRVSYGVRRDLFNSLVQQEIAFFDEHKTGELMSRLTADCSSISENLSLRFNISLRNAVMMAGTLAFMFTLSWRLTLVNFIVIPITIFVTKVYGVFFDKISEKMQDTIANANRTAEEVLSTMKTVRSFGCETKESCRFDDMLDDTLTIGRKRALGLVGSNWSDEFSSSVILIGVLAYGGHLVIAGRLSAESFISFLMYQLQLGENLYYVGYVITGLMTAAGASRKVFEYMHRTPKILNDGKLTNDVQGEINIDGVTFSYPNRPKNSVLKELTLHIKPGETIALVGPSGGGKSSIVSLIEHFYEPEEGEITLDGCPIREYDHTYYHRKIALVSQEPILYEGTVKQNIAYGYEGATEDDILQASKKAHVHDFVMELDRGYDTKCGEKGVQMSDGQKQRIAIARALIRNPSVLVLDEATSALDTESESIIQEALESCRGECTVIIIAHRLSTIEKANRIAVIDKGVIRQIGSHNELMEDREGLYYNLVSRQVQYGI